MLNTGIRIQGKKMLAWYCTYITEKECKNFPIVYSGIWVAVTNMYILY